MGSATIDVIYQKKGPKTALPVRLTNENYDYLCRIAGELSLAAAINELLEKAKESGITFCNSKRPDHTIGAEYHAR